MSAAAKLATPSAAPEVMHTPGPWAPKIDGFSISIFSESRPHIAVAIVGKGGRVSEERDANARLIAAAPDMLAALKAAVARADENRPGYSGRTEECQKDYQACVDAIAKAEGRS